MLPMKLTMLHEKWIKLYAVNMGVRKIFTGSRRFAYPYRVADDAMQTGVHTTLHPTLQ